MTADESGAREPQSTRGLGALTHQSNRELLATVRGLLAMLDDAETALRACEQASDFTDAQIQAQKGLLALGVEDA